MPGSDPEGSFRRLVKEHGVNSVMLECGGRLAGLLLDKGLIDELAVLMAPMITGGVVSALGGDGFPDGLKVDEVRYERFGLDVMMRGVVLREEMSFP